MRDSAALYASFRHHLAEIISRRPLAGQVASEPAPPPPPSAADLEYARVRRGAEARHAAEQKAAAEALATRQAEERAIDEAVASILAARTL